MLGIENRDLCLHVLEGQLGGGGAVEQKGMLRLGQVSVTRDALCPVARTLEDVQPSWSAAADSRRWMLRDQATARGYAKHR